MLRRDLDREGGLNLGERSPEPMSPGEANTNSYIEGWKGALMTPLRLNASSCVKSSISPMRCSASTDGRRL